MITVVVLSERNSSGSTDITLITPPAYAHDRLPFSTDHCLVLSRHVRTLKL